jgi:DNA polymerase elongation subunit (family B)
MKAFIYYWFIEDEENENNQKELKIRAYGLSENSETVIIHINNFNPWLYLEILDNNETSETWINIKTLLKNKIQERSKLLEKKTFYLVSKKKLYFNQDCEYNYFKLKFNSLKEKKQVYYALNNNKIRISNKLFTIKCHENEASALLQLICSKNLNTTGWLEFNGQEMNDNKISYYKEINCHYEDIKLLNQDESIQLGVPNPNILSFDLEVYSHNWQKMPDATNKEDIIFQISCIYESSNKQIKKYLITFENLKQKLVGDDVILISIQNEEELLLEFTKLVRKLNPQVLVGYNIFGFDIPYMIQRAKLYNIYDKFNILGVPTYKHGKEMEISWSSSAYSYQEFHYLETEGRIFIDLLPVIKRDYKFNNYKLKTVSTFFLGETKDPLTAIDIFKAFKNRNEINGIEKLSECGKYCIQDGYLVLKLYNILQLWIGLTEMAKICNVPISYLFTKGQQIKVYSQVYKKCYDENIIVESKVDHDILNKCKEYAGAYVFPPEPSLYNWVVPFDFSSLYPTIIIAYNIDYSTLVLDESKVNLNECNILEWEDHINCEHDLEKKNTKGKKILCQKNRYVFKKSPLGVIPTLLQNLLDARADTKKLMKSLKNDSSITEEMKETLMTVYDKRQLAYKVSANSMYGGMGVQKGYLPFMPGAMSVTAMGRINIQKAAEYVKNQHKGQLIYGDSVIGNTPITIKNQNKLELQTIEELFNQYECIPYQEFKKYDQTLTNKEQVYLKYDLYVYAKNGWSKIKRVIRHKTDKKIYRIITNTGIIDVTEDHSLITKDRKLIKPQELNKDVQLLTYDYDIFWQDLKFDLNIANLLSKIILNENNSIIQIQILLKWSEHTKECMSLYLFFNKKFKNISISIKNDSMILSIHQNPIEKEGQIIDIIELSKEKNYVYDLEVYDNDTNWDELKGGIFHAGIGNIIVKNTDSIYCHFKNHDNALTTWNKAKEIEVELLKLFPKPMKLVFEEKIYKKFLILTKKRYMAYTCNEKDEIDSDLTIRGVLLARRDNCKWIRDFYEIIVRSIMDNNSKIKILELIQDKILELFQWKIKGIKNFTITKLVNKDYKIKPLPVDLKKCKKRLEDLEIFDYKIDKTNEIEIINNNIQEEKIPTIKWFQNYMYKSKPAHVQLAEKMKNRGKPVEIGSRIEYIITTHPNDPKSKLYDKLEDPDFYKLHCDLIRLDRLYYLKNLIMPLDQLLNVVFKIEKFTESLYTLHLTKQKIVNQINNYTIILFDNESLPIEKPKKNTLKAKNALDFYFQNK